MTQNETAMAEKFVKLVNVMKKLREPDGCPWDREQTYMSLRRYIVEEGYELIQAIEDGNVPNMCEECGDLMLQVIFVSCMAEERGDFTVCDVLDGLTNKLIRRHPHVFGNLSLKDSAAVLNKWDEIKAEEKGAGAKPAGAALFKDVPATLSAMLRAREVWKAVTKKGLDAGASADRAKIDALAEALDEEAAGTALFEIVAACRRAGIDPESALRRKTLAVQQVCLKNANAEN